MSLKRYLQALPEDAWANETVSLRPMQTEDDLIFAAYDCELPEAQKGFVSPMWFLLGRAYLSPEENFPCIICSRTGERVGYLQCYRWRGESEAVSWSFFVDRRQQRKGYGTAAVSLAAALLKAACPRMPIRLAVEPDNIAAQRLYRTLGFSQLAETDGDDLIFEI